MRIIELKSLHRFGDVCMILYEEVVRKSDESHLTVTLLGSREISLVVRYVTTTLLST